MRTEELVKHDNEYLLHGLSVVGNNQGFVIESSDGIMLKDTDGNVLMDLSAQAVNINLGHNRRDILYSILAELTPRDLA